MSERALAIHIIQGLSPAILLDEIERFKWNLETYTSLILISQFSLRQ